MFAEFEPKLSEGSRSTDVLFLANIQPDLQREVRAQCEQARFVALDSMNLWIETARDSLIETISGVDCLLLNDAELRQLTREPNLVRAARQIREWGPRVVVAKQGEYGAAMITDEGFFGLPAFPLETVVDPTGAGDSLRRRLRRLRRGPSRRTSSTTSCCAARWPTAPRWLRSTSRSSASSGSHA